MSNTATVSFKVPPHECAVIQLLAYEQSVTVSYLCRAAIRQALHTQERTRDIIGEIQNTGYQHHPFDGPLPDLGPELDLEFIRAVFADIV